MITEIDKETLDFLSKKKLTFNQFCLCLLIVNDDRAGMEQYTNEIGYLTGGNYLTPDKVKVNELEDLLERKFLKHDGKNKEDFYNIDCFHVTDKFLKGFPTAKYKEAAREFYTAYPNDILIKGAASPTGKTAEYNEFEAKYTEIIKKDFGLHAKAMASIRGMRYAPMGIMKFLGSEQYNNVQSGAGKVGDNFY